MDDSQEARQDSEVKNEFKGTLIHGPSKFDLKIPNISEATVKDLSELAFDLTKVPTSKQRLICKGKSLTNFEKKLQDCGVKNGAKILLIGKKHDPEEEKCILGLSKIEKRIDKEEQNFREIEKDFYSLKQGFLDDSKLKESFKRLEKTLKNSENEFMKIIEVLDATELDGSFIEARKKKKGLIQRIQNMQDDADKLEQSQKDYCADKLANL